MRNLHELDRYRITPPWVVAMLGPEGGDDTCGAFLIELFGSPVPLRVLASVGDGWDHVSVSTEFRCPHWGEMEYIKRLFFKDNETAMQLHVPPADHINHHPHTLHLWRPLIGAIPRPPAALVGAPK